MTLNDISKILHVPIKASLTFLGICIDSRKVKPGDLFIAIKGESFDGHEFVKDAVANGATAVVCSRKNSEVDVVQLVVPDTLKALAAIATEHRKKQTCAVVALTGSNGKTSVKEMIASILPKPAHATPGNLNNHIGAPLSVLQLQPEHRYAVFELGANHPGEIAYTVAIVQPQVTLINNIAPAHIEGFGSIEGVAKAKGEIYQGLPVGGTAVVNEDDVFADFWAPLLRDKKVVRFSKNKLADVYARDITFNSQGCAQFTLVLPEATKEPTCSATSNNLPKNSSSALRAPSPHFRGEGKLERAAVIQLRVPGGHNVNNALAAAACTYALGIDLDTIVCGLQQFSGVQGRMTILAGKNHSVVIDDTYNANLRSVLAALDVLATHKGPRILVFGDMGELGDEAKAHHREVGEAARRHGIEMVMTCGIYSVSTSQAFGHKGKHYQTQTDLIHDLLPHVQADTMILVKGSRSAAMEKIVHQLVD